MTERKALVKILSLKDSEGQKLHDMLDRKCEVSQIACNGHRYDEP